MARSRFVPDNFTLALVGTVVLASFLPCRGEAAHAFNWATDIAVGLLFFLHGAKLSREAIVAGATHWRLHALVLLSTFALFPLLGLALKPVLTPLVTPALYAGVLFLCTLPSTVQSSIAFTSIAKGNVPAAVCSASASSLLGIFVTPALVGVMVSTQGTGATASPWSTIGAIVMQLLVPFVAGQLLRPVIGRWIERNRGVLRFVDQGSILLVVYVAFSEAVNEGLWHQIPPTALAGLAVVNVVLLAIALAVTTVVSKRLGFNRADQITIIFCGSKKSLAAGVPMAKVIFAAHAVGAVVLPLMLFHQIQLMTCAALAQRWGARDTSRERLADAPGAGALGSGASAAKR
ncbi:sodium/bile acid symporter family protein [Burkholderia pseudomallei]|uniref:Sodium bile acid symporter family protein n=16 Tax=Pseudomonadota TaxID=1224 RepID=Q63Y64_BURPS|nr:MULTISPECIES: bile acid:sodium symporter family protein [pseudomallei group]AAU48909.1 sodium/bile acid symporter family protein [Burkholderia mallei ATCC 23344]ABM50804.1 sodium/bile acid symporter family protein [Burkholderia mallei SAVP1]ABN03738.1 sodium/bile acid symporter family protein [Burkholderia mallei NCTC 10229]ABN84313.1 sodium/bile acid symporter family protein [Burkholderia pseudomallei 668]ABO05964.1 sodium/bile acid symporter family protein [Burkholderia mallei NCTC 10247]